MALANTKRIYETENQYKKLDSHNIHLKNKLTETHEKIDFQNKKIKDLESQIQENERKMVQTNLRQRQTGLDNEKKLKSLNQDFQLSQIKVNNLEDTLTALTFEHGKTLKRLSNANTDIKLVENIVFRMQTRESHMVVLIKNLQKARKKLESQLHEREKELFSFSDRFLNLTHLMVWLKTVSKRIYMQIISSKKQLCYMKEGIRKNFKELLVTRAISVIIVDQKKNSHRKFNEYIGKA